MDHQTVFYIFGAIALAIASFNAMSNRTISFELEGYASVAGSINSIFWLILSLALLYKAGFFVQ